MNHARGDGCANQPTCGNTSLRTVSSFITQLPSQSIPGNAPGQGSILVYFLGRLFCISGISQRRSNTTAIIADHGKTVYIIIYNSNTNTKSLSTVLPRRFATGGIINVGGISRSNSGQASSKVGFVIQGHNTIAVAVGKSHHAGNSDRIPLTSIFDLILQIHRVAGRSLDGLCPLNLRPFASHNQGIAPDVLKAHRSPNAHLAIFFRCTVSTFGISGCISGQLHG